ncbi:NADPH-dependent FMN reductase [Paenibacillus oralis]|nr:NAD(P)H-dependent oxidoreductase [Paenibacillus oralis]
MKSVHVLGLLGSLRERSRTELALTRCLAAAQREGAETSVFDLRKSPLPLCDGRDDPSLYPEAVHALRRQVEQADALVFASPEYIGSYSAAIKNVLDFLGPDHLRGKIAGVIGVAADHSASNTVYHLSTILLRCGCWVVPIHAQIPASEIIFEQPDSPSAQKMLTILDALGRDIVVTVRRHHSGKPTV